MYVLKNRYLWFRGGFIEGRPLNALVKNSKPSYVRLAGGLPPTDDACFQFHLLWEEDQLYPIDDIPLLLGRTEEY